MFERGPCTCVIQVLIGICGGSTALIVFVKGMTVLHAFRHPRGLKPWKLHSDVNRVEEVKFPPAARGGGRHKGLSSMRGPSSRGF